VNREDGPKVAVIIPVLNGARAIGRQLDALCEQQGAPPFEVVVADNGSRDDLHGALRPFAARLDLRVIDAGAVPGASYARNRAAAATGADFLLFCDADDVVGATWVSALVGALEQGAGQATGPVLYVSAPPSEGDLASRRMPTSPRLFMGLVPFAPSNNLAMRADLFRRMGGFDESLKRGMDADLTVRASLVGDGLAWVQDSVVFNVVRPTVTGAMRQFFWYGVYDVALDRKLRPEGVRPRSIAQQVRPYAGLVGRCHRVLTPSGRRSWLTKASQHAGRLCGSLRFGWWCP
jgi:glycosyltransferase involved in cell wall biosynthesis